jgi:hypothetical protein
MNGIALLLIFISELATAQHVPSFEEVISLRSVNAVSLSADGKQVAYTVQTTDWTDNRFDTEIWLSKNMDKPFQLTYTSKNNSTNPDGITKPKERLAAVWHNWQWFNKYLW